MSIEWGSVADWVSGLGTVGAILIALRKPRDQFLFTITRENKLKIENLAPVKSNISVKSNKYSDRLNKSFTLNKFGESKSCCEISLPYEYSVKVKLKLKAYNLTTGITTHIKIIIVPIQFKDSVQTLKASLYRRELGIYRKEYGTKLKIDYKTLQTNDKPRKINEL